MSYQKINFFLFGLIIIAIIPTFTACANNRPTKLVGKNIEGYGEKADDESHESSKYKDNDNSQILDSWIGHYIFTEYIDSEDYTKFYEVFISKDNSNYNAKIKIEDFGVYSDIQAKPKGDANRIDFIFSNYLADETNTNTQYNIGDILLSFTMTDKGIRTHWSKIQPTNDISKVDGTYFKIRESNEGYAGHWYTSLPYTGGNSTAIEVREMSDTSVSLHLYFCRTYYYDGIDIKLENDIAKFVDNGDYKTSGTIEFVNKSIIVTIEKTELPILKIGKTIFYYKVDEFEALSITPNSGAVDVEIGNGIEIDFGRRISPTVMFTGFLRKANVPSGSADGAVEMNMEIKGNKLMFLPNYDSMKLYKQVIESGQKYELYIGEGEFRDEVGNINIKIKIEFTTKK